MPRQKTFEAAAFFIPEENEEGFTVKIKNGDCTYFNAQSIPVKKHGLIATNSSDENNNVIQEFLSNSEPTILVREENTHQIENDKLTRGTIEELHTDEVRLGCYSNARYNDDPHYYLFTPE